MRRFHIIELDGIDDQPGDYLTDRLTDEALKFIDDNSDEPFFLYLSHFAVHDPIQGRADLVAKYKKKRSRLPADDTPFILEGNPDAERAFTRAERKAMLDDPAYADYRILPNPTTSRGSMPEPMAIRWSKLRLLTVLPEKGFASPIPIAMRLPAGRRAVRF